MDTGNSRSQGNKYDKIFRENMEAALPAILKHLLGMEIAGYETLTDEIQHTRERKPDVLRRVTDNAGKTFVLHLECQVKNEKDMALRMAEYYIMLLRKYRLPVKQHVLFLGKGKARMPLGITEDEFHFRYNMVNMSEVDFRVFLRSPHPEEKVMAILANFGTDGTVQALSHIIRDIHESVPDDLAKARYFRQLRVLAQLRNLNIKITEIMGDVSSYFSDDKDILYRLGQERGREQGMEQGMETARLAEKELFVLNLLQHTDFSDDRIATLAAVDTGFVREKRKRSKAGRT